MWFRLALKFGCTVDELQGRMSSAEFGEWIAHYALEPWGDRIEDLRMGTVAALLFNMNRGKGVKALAPDDFISWTYKTPVPAEAKSPEAVAMDAFGLDLVAIKKSGVKTFTIKRPKKE